MSKQADIEKNHDIEKEISEKLDKSKQKGKNRDWFGLYELLYRVHEQKLYFPRYRSFTAFINHLAEQNDVHASSIWRTYKAGSILQAYNSEYIESREGSAQRYAGLTIENLILMDKIIKNTEEEKQAVVKMNLLEKLRNGALSRESLTNLYKAIRLAEKDEQVLARKKSEKGFIFNEWEGNLDVVMALQDPSWLFLQKEQYKHFRSKRENPHYRLFVDVRFQVSKDGDEYYRFDALVAENQTGKTPHELILHGIKVIAFPHHVHNAWGTWAFETAMRFVDRFYFAVWSYLVEDVMRGARPEIGIISVDFDKKATLIREAQPLHPDKRERTLEAVALQLI